MGTLHPRERCLECRTLPSTWAPATGTRLWREMVGVEKLPNVMGNPASTLHLSCPVPRGRPCVFRARGGGSRLQRGARERAVGGGRWWRGERTVSRLLVMFVRGHEAAVC